MKAARVKVGELKTCEQLSEMIDRIENDPDNVVGGVSAWNSGFQTYLTKTAKNKIQAIGRKLERLPFENDTCKCEGCTR